tara:strand:+ start:66 stop:497 length:432 start_codon:yes stop_codon:yes gene_type:complete
MVLPLIVGGVILIGGVWYAVDKTDGRIEEITDEAKDAFVSTGIPILQSIGEGLGDGLEFLGEGISEGLGILGGELGDLGSDIGDAALKVLRRSGIAVIEGAEDIFDYTYNKVAPYRVETVTAVTAMLIYSITALTIFKKIRAN